MEYQIYPISGHCFDIKLLPVTIREQSLLDQNNDQDAIEAFYEHAVKLKLDRHIHVTSVIPNDDFPYSATIEIFADSSPI
ncbi:MAG TPA: hypothetical protein VL442_13705 [Mucilaginibacter sp.]|jgi:hypothetical protein|nr:hypothetical protein [Mucilaginibacter sp.]